MSSFKNWLGPNAKKRVREMIKRILEVLLLVLLMYPAAGEEKIASPEFSFKGPQIPGLEQFFSDYEKKVHSNFMADYEHTKSEPDMEIINPWSMDLEAKQSYSGKFLTVVVRGYDYRGGAHGITYLDVLYFEPKSKKELSQQDLLEKNALETFSTLARQELIKQGFEAKDDWMLEGTEPFVKNFKFIAPSEEAVTVIFPSYQIAPYAAGVPEVQLPWEKVRGVFKEAYRP